MLGCTEPKRDKEKATILLPHPKQDNFSTKGSIVPLFQKGKGGDRIQMVPISSVVSWVAWISLAKSPAQMENS